MTEQKYSPTQERQVMTHITFRDHLKVIFRQKWIVLFTIALVSATSWFLLEFNTPVYEAQVKMLIVAEKQVESQFFKESTNDHEMEASVTQSEIVKSKPVLQRTIEALSLDKRPLDYERSFATPLKQSLIDAYLNFQARKKSFRKDSKNVAFRKALADLKDNIDVEPVRDSNIFTITARDFDPAFAATLANSVSRSYVVYDLKQQMVDLKGKYTDKNLMVMQMAQNISIMEKGLDGQPLPSEEAIGPASVKIIEQSTPPLEPVGLPKKVLLLVAIFMSLPLAIVLAYTFQALDQSFYSKQDVEKVLGLPVIACINKKKDFAKPQLTQDVSDTNKCPRSVSYRILAQQILFLIKNKAWGTYLFVPTHIKDNCSAVVANTALFLSKGLGLRTLIIDANLRHPRQHQLFSTSSEKGLAQVLEGKLPPAEAIVSVENKLDLIPSGISGLNPSVLLDAVRFRSLLEKQKSNYDVILIDGPDTSVFRDSSLIAPAVDAVFLTVGESLARKQTVFFYAEALREAKCHLAGVILSNRNYLIPKFIYESL